MEGQFRKMRRFKQQLTHAECLELLKQEIRGTLAVNGDDGYPYAFPMNYAFDEESGNLYLHCAKQGYKIDAIRRNDKVCFCLHDKGYSQDGNLPLNFKSIVIFGRIKLIEHPEDSLRCMRKFDRKFESDEAVEAHIQREANIVQALELVVDYMTGKRVIEK